MVIFISTMLLEVHAIQFDVHPGEKRCIFEDYTKGQVVQGNYKIPQVAYMQISIRILAPQREDPVWANADANEGTYAFTADDDGIYSFCFSDKPRLGVQATGKPMTRRITFTARDEWEMPFDDKDMVVKSELKPIEYLIKSIEDKMDKLKREIKEQRQREYRHQETTLTTAWRIPTLSSFTIFLLIGCGVLQMIYLRSYFRKKKLV